MERLNIVKITDKRGMNDFVRFPRLHYRGCKEYVPDLEQDVREMFNPKKNAGLEISNIQAFVAYRNDVPVGRVAAIINHRANEKWGTRNVRFGLLEFVDDNEVSEALLAAVAAWGREHGMTHIQGPMGITDFDKEGMLVEDFDLMGSMAAIYNYDYYPRHMERLGFEKEVDWLHIRIQVPQEVPARYARVAQYAREQIGLRVRKLTRKEVMGSYGQEVFRLLNTAYSPIFGFAELTEQQAQQFITKYLSIVDLQLMPVVENDKGELVGVAVTTVSLAEALQKAGGRMLPTGWMHLLNGLKWHKADWTEMLLVAVRPDYQGLGVNALFFDDLIPIYNNMGIRWAETGPQLEDNVRELSQWKPLNPEFVKRRRCYKKEIC